MCPIVSSHIAVIFYMYKGHSNYQSLADSNVLRGGLTPTPERRNNNFSGIVGTHRISNSENAKDTFRKNSQPSPPTNIHMTSTGPVQLPKWDITPGTLGICNHGNTCFMNTILQCLSCTDLLAEYFILKKYKESQNGKSLAKKIVGTAKAEVCEEIGHLLESLWSGKYVPDISNHLKSVVSKHNTQYKGSSQHDAQEFFLWLLDRLNEELHFSSKKKSKDIPNKWKKEKQNEGIALSSPEAVLASCSGFDIYNRFQALYKSSLICPACGKPSNTYESYLCLSLPVPQKNTRSVFVTIVYLDDSPKQLKIALEMYVMDTLRDLREKLSHELHVTPMRLVMCQIADEGFVNTYGDDQPLSDVNEFENVFVFETYPLCEVNKTPGLDLIQILLVHVEKNTTDKCSRFCSPEVIKVSRDMEFARLQRCILKSMKFAVTERTVERAYSGAIFDIRIVDSGPTDAYLPTDVDMPLYTEPIDRALSTYNEDYGPAHVKFVIEWDPETKRKLVVDDEDFVQEHDSVHKARLSLEQPTSVSLEECLQLFTKEEKLEEGETWQCPSCEKNQEGAIKKLGLWSAPDILVIHLKRFRHCGLKRNKLNTLVDFPKTDLDMGQHLLPVEGHGGNTTDLYDLYAVSNHYGNMSGGHYTAFCKNPVDMRWYEYDDTTVRPIHKRDIVSRAAYLLFYQRKKLINNTINSLRLKQHWVYSLNGPPRTMQTVCTSPLEDRKPTVNFLKERYGRETDYSELYVNKVRLEDTDSRIRATEVMKEKSSPLTDKQESWGTQEEALMQELRHGINSPRLEHKNALISEEPTFDRDVYAPMRVNLDVTSPRRENSIASLQSLRTPLKEASRESPRKELFPDQSSRSNRQYFDAALARNKTTVAEQIIQSQLAQQIDSVNMNTLSPRNISTAYRRSDSVDSSKNSQPYTSGSEASPNGSAPSSPQDINVLNNERNVNMLNGSYGTVGKLKIYSNEIHGNNMSLANDVSNGAIISLQKTDNQKMNNNTVVEHSAVRVDVLSTPQQTRKSPSPQRHVWSTPQPGRRHVTVGERRPSTDRQHSAASRNTGTKVYPDQDLSIQGHAILDNQPRSLPLEKRTVADKPPRPIKPSRPASAITRQSSSNSSNVSNLPVTANTLSSNISDVRQDKMLEIQSAVVYNNESRPVCVVDGPQLVVHSREPSYSDNRPVLIGEQLENQSRGRHGSDQAIREVRHRNRSADRPGRGSVRTRSERPLSYHHTLDSDYDDYYYLSQPVDDVTPFERSTRYATMQPVRHNQIKQFSEDNFLQRQFLDYRIPGSAYHEPRSRAPVMSYNPQLYQDTSHRFGHYQPHLHEARKLTKMAIQEKEYMQRKMKAEYLKESSV